MAAIVATVIVGLPACGYHRLDKVPHPAAWMKKGSTIRLAKFKNLTPRLGLEERFTKAQIGRAHV